HRQHVWNRRKAAFSPAPKPEGFIPPVARRHHDVGMNLTPWNKKPAPVIVRVAVPENSAQPPENFAAKNVCCENGNDDPEEVHFFSSVLSPRRAASANFSALGFGVAVIDCGAPGAERTASALRQPLS